MKIPGPYPQMAATSYQVVEDRSVEARMYSVHQDGRVFKMTVAEVADTGLEGSALIDLAIKMTSTDRLQQQHFNFDGAIRNAEQGSAAE
jgi:hypothetical protein